MATFSEAMKALEKGLRVKRSEPEGWLKLGTKPFNHVVHTETLCSVALRASDATAVWEIESEQPEPWPCAAKAAAFDRWGTIQEIIGMNAPIDHYHIYERLTDDQLRGALFHHKFKGKIFPPHVGPCTFDFTTALQKMERGQDMMTIDGWSLCVEKGGVFNNKTQVVVSAIKGKWIEDRSNPVTTFPTWSKP